MNARFYIAVCVISVLAGIGGKILLGAPVGATSEWGIVIMPCAWCSKTNDIQVHHIVSQGECRRTGRLDLIRDTNNMVCLCRTGGKGCHFYVGHHGIRWSYIFTNVMQAIRIKGE